jgi:ketol-acid reductoisomerase
VLTTDESQPLIWQEQILPGLKPGKTLLWASGYNVGFDLIQPPPDADVIMIAPRMIGATVRELYLHGSGTLAQIAVHQDASGRAWDTMLALCKGMGLTRGGVFESSFREEAELDLFAEQVVWAGLEAWFVECFELGVAQGFSPELMVMELYASGETAEIFAKMTKNGFFRQMAYHSTTSQYGTLSRGPSLINDAMRARAREIVRGIHDGSFVKEWRDEQASGSTRLAALREQAFAHPMSQAEGAVIAAVQAVARDL